MPICVDHGDSLLPFQLTLFPSAHNTQHRKIYLHFCVETADQSGGEHYYFVAVAIV
jgi:hypothetical protein